MATVTRIVHDPETRAYVDKRQVQGRTTKEIRRCLKRYLARPNLATLETPHILSRGLDEVERSTDRIQHVEDDRLPLATAPRNLKLVPHAISADFLSSSQQSQISYLLVRPSLQISSIIYLTAWCGGNWASEAIVMYIFSARFPLSACRANVRRVGQFTRLGGPFQHLGLRVGVEGFE